ncbi:hypothetical protein DL95DRAFT_386692, partial [Leptodontidium sp. 2 PMI_412]
MTSFCTVYIVIWAKRGMRRRKGKEGVRKTGDGRDLGFWVVTVTGVVIGFLWRERGRRKGELTDIAC